MKIRILTLTGQRDKHIDNILKEELKKRGHDTEVRSYIYAGRETITYEKPEVVIHPMPGGEYKMDFIKKCKEWGCTVITRRGEAGMDRTNFNNLDTTRQQLILGGWDYQKYVDLELVWGHEFKNVLIERGKIEEDKIKACGAFAFDPYFKPGYARNMLPGKKKTILFATGFSTADCKSDHCELGVPEGDPYHKEIYDMHRRGRDIWIKTINKMAARFDSDWQFEVKVRPGEMTTEYHKKLDSRVGIHKQESSPAEVLRDTDVLVHSGSTMAIEAHLLNIPSFNYHNMNPDPLLASVSPNIDGYEDLEFHIHRSNRYCSNIREDVYAQLQQKLYGKIDGQACCRAADYIQELIQDEEHELNIPNTWPKEVLYPTDGIRIQPVEGDVTWTCPSCRNGYFTGPVKLSKCPWCGMVIERTVQRVARSVVK